MNLIGYIIAALFAVPALIGIFIAIKITNSKDAQIESVDIEPWSLRFNISK